MNTAPWNAASIGVYGADGGRGGSGPDQHRPVKVRYPLPSTVGSSSTTDYEQVTLDANGNATSRRLRDGTSFGYAYDSLNQVTTKTVPGTAYLDVL